MVLGVGDPQSPHTAQAHRSCIQPPDRRRSRATPFVTEDEEKQTYSLSVEQGSQVLRGECHPVLKVRRVRSHTANGPDLANGPE